MFATAEDQNEVLDAGDDMIEQIMDLPPQIPYAAPLGIFPGTSANAAAHIWYNDDRGNL